MEIKYANIALTTLLPLGQDWPEEQKPYQAILLGNCARPIVKD